MNPFRFHLPPRLWAFPGIAATLWLAQVAAAAPFAPGEILLNNSWGSNVQRYSADGSLLQTYTGTDTPWSGTSLTPSGQLAMTFDGTSEGVLLLNADGTTSGSFAVPGNTVPGEVNAFADGTLAVIAQFEQTVQIYDQSGTLLNTVSMPGVGHPIVGTVGTDNILYVAGMASSSIGRVDQSGAFLGSFGLSFVPGDLVMSPLDGTLWVCGYQTNTVHHLTTSGTVLGSFATGLSGLFSAIGIAPDGQSLYVTTRSSAVIRHLDLSGSLLGDINIISPDNPGLLTVVPAPEPSAALLLGGAGLGLLLRRRRG